MPFPDALKSVRRAMITPRKTGLPPQPRRVRCCCMRSSRTAGSALHEPSSSNHPSTIGVKPCKTPPQLPNRLGRSAAGLRRAAHQRRRASLPPPDLRRSHPAGARQQHSPTAWPAIPSAPTAPHGLRGWRSQAGTGSPRCWPRPMRSPRISPTAPSRRRDSTLRMASAAVAAAHRIARRWLLRPQRPRRHGCQNDKGRRSGARGHAAGPTGERGNGGVMHPRRSRQ